MNNMEIETERLILRRFKAEDWKDLYEYLSDEDVVIFEPYAIYTEDGAKREALRRSQDENFWAVCLKENGKLIGNLYFAKQDFDNWELGYVFNKKYQKHGYATEAARAIMEYGVRHWGTRRIVAMCNPHNTASWKLLERVGMRREGHLLRNIYFKVDEMNQPIWLDTYEYGILSTEMNLSDK